MREIVFSEADVQSIGFDRYHHPDPQVQRQMEILWLKHHDFTHERIAVLAGCSRSTVQRTLSDFLLGGLEQVRLVLVKESHSELDDHRPSELLGLGDLRGEVRDEDAGDDPDEGEEAAS